jgi:hypothetical protein
MEVSPIVGEATHKAQHTTPTTAEKMASATAPGLDCGSAWLVVLLLLLHAVAIRPMSKAVTVDFMRCKNLDDK